METRAASEQSTTDRNDGSKETLPRSGVLPKHNLVPDLIAVGLKVVFCGTALGRVSAEKGAYYANSANKFWRTLHETGLTPDRIEAMQYERLLALKMGLTDISKTHFGNDNELSTGAYDPDALREKIQDYRPKILAFTSKKAASVALKVATRKLNYGPQSQRIAETQVWVLPSPSGQGARWWNIAHWQALAKAARALDE